VPLAIALILLIFFKSVQVVIWYSVLLAGFGFVFAGTDKMLIEDLGDLRPH
jgi:uncharacterized protein YqfA (UPF0365 family)